MDKSVRSVIARYQEGPNTSPSLQNRDWVSYLKDKQEGSPKAPSVVLKMLKDVAKGENTDKKKELSKPFTQYNPYDYKDPSDKPKDLKDSPPFQDTSPIFPSSEIFNHPNLFKDESSLREWYKSRERDWTEDEQEQAPAMSLTNKYARVVAQYLGQILPVEFCLEASEGITKTAASLEEIIRADSAHYKSGDKRNRATQVAVVPRGSKNSQETGLFLFDASSPGSVKKPAEGSKKRKKKNESPYRVTVQLLRTKGKRPATYVQYPVQMSCTCDSFLYYGAQYYAVHGGYMHMKELRPSLVPPTSQDMVSGIHKSERYPNGKKHPGRGLNFRACKHIIAVYNWMKSKNLKITTYYRNYPEMGPPSAIINKETWEDMMGFPFEKSIFMKKLRVKRPKVPDFFASSFFKNKRQSQKLNKWFKEVWVPREDSEKIKILNTLVMHPEEIFFLVIKDAYYTRGETSDVLISAAYDLIDKTVQEENKQKPEGEKSEDGQVGMGPVEKLPEEGEDVKDPGEVSEEKEPKEEEEKIPDKEEEEKIPEKDEDEGGKKPSDVKSITKDVSSPAERNKKEITDTSNLNTNL